MNDQAAALRARLPARPGEEQSPLQAVAITGGLVSCTALTFVVTPAVFFAFGRRSAERALAAHGEAFE